MALPGGVLADRAGRKRALLRGGTALLAPPIVYAYVSAGSTPAFGLVFICFGLSAIVSGLV